MKIRIILVIMLMLLLNFSFSQEIRIETNKSSERINYLKLAQDNAIIDSLILNTPSNPVLFNYYKNVYKAENYIMKGRYGKAAETYQTAFSFLEYPFAEDLRHALICEMQSRRNEENIKNYMRFLISKGEDVNKFINDSTYHVLPNWNEIKSIIENITPLVNRELIDTINVIHERDQNVRQKNDDYGTESYNNALWTVDLQNYEQIMQILEKYPIISEELIGIKGWKEISIIPWHSPYRLDIYIKLHESVVRGKLDARKYFHILDHSEYLADNKYSMGVWGDFSGIIINIDDFELPEYTYIEVLKPDNTKIINKYRKKLYIESYNDYNNKIIVDV